MPYRVVVPNSVNAFLYNEWGYIILPVCADAGVPVYRVTKLTIPSELEEDLLLSKQ